MKAIVDRAVAYRGIGSGRDGTMASDPISMQATTLSRPGLDRDTESASWGGLMGNVTRPRSTTRLSRSDAASPGDAYEIVVGARLGRRWADQFDGFEMIDAGDGTTVLRGAPPDQSTMFGVLGRIRDIGAPLVAVRRVPG